MAFNLSYRPDIDGLRAYAVLSVVLYHAGFSWFGGGYTGVDVFFVISGFLITQMIRGDIANGSFSFTRFYTRRARRLLPAQVVTLAATAIAAFCLLSPNHFELYGRSLKGAAFSYSNIYFWKQAGYFDIEASLKPLLHTWSLSVEEQFYLLWPACLLALSRIRKSWAIPLFLVALGALSLWLNFYHQADNHALFYLIPFRAYEFAIGALMVWLVQVLPKQNGLREIAVIVGFAMVFAAAHVFSKNIIYPLHYGLLPCVGAALLLYGGGAKITGFLLRNRLAVGLGKVSYSLYLVHWPILVFYRYWRFDEISDGETYALLLLSLLVAVVMYYKVEQPGRYSPWALNLPTKKLAHYGFTVLFSLAVFGYAAQHSHGLALRVPKPQLTETYQTVQSYAFCKDGYGSCTPPAATPDDVIIGDSHASRAEIYLGVIAERHRRTLAVHSELGCFGLYHSGLPCAQVIDDVFENALKRHVKNVFLVSNWSPLTHHYPVDQLMLKMQSTIQMLHEHGVMVYVVGAMPVMRLPPTTCCSRPFFVNTSREFMVPIEYEKQAAFNAELKRVVTQSGARYLDVFSQLCHSGTCRIAYQGLSLYGDRMHFDAQNISGLLLEPYVGKNVSYDDLFLK